MTTTSPHKTAALGQIHSPVNWTFNGDTARRLPSAYVTTDLGGECMQTDTSPPTFWKLVALAGSGLSVTPTWRQITTTADGAAFSLASIYPGSYQVLQTDLGLTYGGTPKATAGNTSATVLTLAGTLTGTPVPVLVKATNTATVGSGATFNIYYDGGTTPAMTGVALSTTPTALTGAGAGLTIAATVASSVTNDTWKATCSALADQSGNAKHAIQATAAAQPVITVGVNGKVGLLFDGVDDVFDTAALTLPLTTVVIAVLRVVAAGSFKYIVDSSALGNRLAMYIPSSGAISLNNGAQLDGVLATSALARVAGTWDTSGTLKVGSNAQVNGSSGASSSAGAGRRIGATSGGSFANVELFALVYAPAGASLTGADSAINSAAGYGVGNVLV